ncbi:unnamed protein product [Brachionus calyciflorus]|uniref:Uncharacterized protein n=1 Tax=Brachionus calyciflorus TaxID=104777 RepID=A0A814LXY5_9BILA|nr:unnamed protein product [Brachionus calyciflorus]
MEDTYNLIQKQLKAIHISEVKTELNKFEKKDGILEVYSQWLKEVLPKCKSSFDDYNKSLNFFDKVEKLNEAYESAEVSDKPAWRFVDDSNKSIDAFLLEDKKRLVNSLSELNEKYDLVIQSLEKELAHKSQEFRLKLSQFDKILE